MQNNEKCSFTSIISYILIWWYRDKDNHYSIQSPKKGEFTNLPFYHSIKQDLWVCTIWRGVVLLWTVTWPDTDDGVWPQIFHPSLVSQLSRAFHYFQHFHGIDDKTLFKTHIDRYQWSNTSLAWLTTFTSCRLLVSSEQHGRWAGWLHHGTD